jgi:hypothetical protein
MAQEINDNDTASTIYEKLEEFSKKGRVWQWIHSTIFVPPEPDKPPPAPKLPPRRVNPYDRYKGRVVRHVIIDAADPFGYSVEDTVPRQVNRIQNLGNMMHRKTRPVIVRNLLLVRPYDRLDPLKITESERVLRTSPAINDARVRVQPVEGSKDSVDVIVRVLDRWSLDVGADGDLRSGNVRATERNLLGLGQELEQRASLHFNERFVSLRGHHRIYNIGRSYVSSFASYEMGPVRDHVGVSVNRYFYSPLARWAGGVSANKSWIRPEARVFDRDAATFLEPKTLDTWLARSFPLDEEDPESGRLSNIVVGARVALLRYDKRPEGMLDPLGVYNQSTLVLGGIGLSQRQYYKERYLFRFGVTEDVPEGLLIRFIAGVEQREFVGNIPYVGAELARGRNHSGFGYLGYELAYGTFIAPEGIFDGTLRGGIMYFTELITLGRWHLRNFIRAGSVMGFNKPAYSRLRFSRDMLYGFESHSQTGNHRTTFNFETILYAPWDLIGFRIAPVLLIGYGILGEENEPFLKGRAFSSFTAGLLVRNERLLMNTFEITLSFYPYIPEEDGPVWKRNGFTNFTPGTRGYDFTSPHLIGYH